MIGSGAFTTVEAERTMSIEINDDSEAYLATQPLDKQGNTVAEGKEPEAQNKPYAAIEEDTGRLSLTFDSLNSNAETVLNKVFQVANEGTQEVGIYFEKRGDNTGAVSFFGNNSELNINNERLDVDRDAAIRLGEGKSIDVSVEFDTYGVGPEDDIMNTLVINGDAEVDGL